MFFVAVTPIPNHQGFPLSSSSRLVTGRSGSSHYTECAPSDSQSHPKSSVSCNSTVHFLAASSPRIPVCSSLRNDVAPCSQLVLAHTCPNVLFQWEDLHSLSRHRLSKGNRGHLISILPDRLCTSTQLKLVRVTNRRDPLLGLDNRFDVSVDGALWSLAMVQHALGKGLAYGFRAF